MNTIGNKMFAYIDNHSALTTNMINQYRDSLIFLGDEQQIFAPAINTYIGIGKTSYQSLLNSISNTNSGITEYDKYIHNDSVTAIFTQFSPDELVTYVSNKPNGVGDVRGISINRDSAYTAFKANRNIVLKGLNNYVLDQTNTDELGRTLNVVNTSGITVNIEHASNLHTGKYVFNGQEYSYTYYDPYDTITIDDTKTWSYIMASNTYMIDFITKFSSQQADRVYKNLIGNTDVVYIEKKFNEAFNYDTVTGILTQFRDVYVKLKDDSYARVTVENDANGQGYSILYNGNVIYTNNDNISQVDITNILADQGGYNTYALEGGGNKYEPVWYHFDNNSTASDNINIADGIQTLKEVAYILDGLTDGKDDDGINLAYNISYNYIEIQELKKWQSNIGNNTVSSFVSESGNELLTVNYYSSNLWDKDRVGDGNEAIGKVKLDLDLRLAQTYVLNDVTYAAYLNDVEVPDNYKTYFVFTGDPTNINNYYHPNSTLENLVIEKYGNNITLPYYRINFDSNNKIINVDQLGNVNASDIDTLDSNVYIYFPYEKHQYDFTKGLTDVKWVTSYVREVYNDLNNRINNLNVSDQIEAAINLLDYSDTDESNKGMFVSKVEENNGIISVTKSKLPLDTILKNDVFSTSDVYIHISLDDAKNYKDSGKIYLYDSTTNTYTQVPNNHTIYSNDTGLFYDELYYKLSINSMQPVESGATINDLIVNLGNTSYFRKEQVANSDIDNYIPIDVQTLYTQDINNEYFTNDVVNNNIIYYWTATNTQIKYFDVDTKHLANGSTKTLFTSYITYLSVASPNNSGLADAWDVRRTIESMFKWVDIKTNKIIE